MNFKTTSLIALIVGRTLAISCWSTEFGYPCCELKSTVIEYDDAENRRKYGIENNHICGINDIQLCPEGGDLYKCCNSCEVIYTDSTHWGVENDSWCSIPYSCGLDKQPTEDEMNETISITTTTTTTSSSSTTTTTTSTTTSATLKPTTNNQECATSYGICGGTEYPNAPNCCEPGNFCWKKYDTIHQCIPEEYRSIVENNDNDEPTTSSEPTLTKAPEPTSNVECSKAYYPCGGSYYPDLPNCCEPGFVCIGTNDVIKQCLPEEDYATTTTTTTTTTRRTTTITMTTTTEKVVPTGECAKAYAPCGGLEYPDVPECCEPGFACLKKNPNYHQCIPEEAVSSHSANDAKTSTVTTTTTSRKSMPAVPTSTTTTRKSMPAVPTSTTTENPQPSNQAGNQGFPPFFPPFYPPQNGGDQNGGNNQQQPYNPSGQCANAYDACGGLLYPDAPRCCIQGCTCVKESDNVSHCIPDYLIEGKNNNTQCAKAYEMCGGYGYEQKCCESGTICKVFSEYHHQCIPLTGSNNVASVNE